MPLKIAEHQITEHQAEGYKINTELYTGPLDLLLDLIERAELDITHLALAQVTDQYLEYMHKLVDCSAAEVSAFLVIAARLVLIKSAALLPRPPAIDLVEPDAIEDGEALARQLRLYRRFKQLAKWLEERQESGYHSYLRIGSPSIKTNARLDPADFDLNELMQIARQVLLNPEHFIALSNQISSTRVTIREKIHAILSALQISGSTNFNTIVENRSRLDIVVTFLAMLELIKLQNIEARQADLFGEISLELINAWDEKSDIESDFNE